jgi:hypothetical protein
MAMDWLLKAGVEAEDLGLLPGMLDDADPRPAREQFDANYPWGGYWRSEGASIDDKHRLCYPGDPPLDWLAMTTLRDEIVLVYPGSFVVILQRDGSLLFQRMD